MGLPVRPLKNAPIREALIDIRVFPSDTITAEKLNGFKAIFSDSYPVTKETRLVKATFANQASPEVTAEDVFDGLRFSSKDNTRFVQTRLNGFTINCLKPYGTYEDFKPEAQRLWLKYAELAKPKQIVRIGLRYINDLEIPSPSYNISDVFDSISIPLTDDVRVRGYSFRFAFERNAPHDKAHVLIDSPPRKEPTNNIVLDIEVGRTFETSPSEDELWSALDNLRDWKNEIFFVAMNNNYLQRYE